MYIIIPTHNEDTVFDLLNIAINNKNIDDKIIIYDDHSESVFFNKLKIFCDLNDVIIYQHKFDGMDFSQHWNYIHTLIPKNEWLVWIAADEIIDPLFFSSLKREINDSKIEKFNLPRINTYYDETAEQYKIPDIDWNGNLYAIGFRYPDWQGRVYKNIPKIRWIGKVHEEISGNSSQKDLSGKVFTIIHHRSRQKVGQSDMLYRKIGHPAYNK